MKFIKWVNGGITLLLLLGILALAYKQICPKRERALPPLLLPPLKTLPLPFASSTEEEAQCFDAPFALRYHPPQLELPDLHDQMVFAGINERPDAPSFPPIIYLGCLGEESHPCSLGQPCYLQQEQKRGSPAYHMLRGEKESHLWVIPRSLEGENLQLDVHMVDGEGKQITEPGEHQTLLLRPHPLQGHGSSWELEGGIRVDATLFSRFHARWMGPNLFLEEHGGDPYAFCRGRECIHWEREGKPEYLFVREGDWVVWKERGWQQAKEGEETGNYPLLICKGVEGDRLHFQLYDSCSTRKTNLFLMRTSEHASLDHLARSCSFASAKTWQKLTLLIGEDRLEVSPGDWLLHANRKWTPLESLEAIENYAQGTLEGELLVVEGFDTREGRRELGLTLYSNSRATAKHFFLPLSSESTTAPLDPLLYALRRGEEPDLEDLDSYFDEREEDSSPEPANLPPLLRIPEVLRGLVDDFED